MTASLGQYLNARAGCRSNTNGFLLTSGLLLIANVYIFLRSCSRCKRRPRIQCISYLLPKLHKRHLKHVSFQSPVYARVQFMHDQCIVHPVNYMPYSCQKHRIRYYQNVYEWDGINHVWPIENSSAVLNASRKRTYIILTPLNPTFI